ncbi:PAS domain S-box-containing protein [Desulfobaculum xiamenense]|uniref:histidine kinase n=1 Tax=Desulfobaculum xiamenense TaxID=995050 RepID=A0A846QG98_9BACT|nr:transporter substrate-binding domain-containing protein [Desulfobaculum xiamenense]NJB67826.1 PAS domain S-box-containing protein [Desulfobaculum xiamenense]
MTILTRIIAIMVIVLVFCQPAASRVEPDPLTPVERAWIEKHADSITFVYDDKFPPFEFRDGRGRFAGLGADYLHLIEQKLGVTFNTRTHSDWNVVLGWLRTGEGDAITMLTKTPERTAFLIYTEPYVDVPCVIVVRRDNQDVQRLEDLRNRRVAVVSGYAIESFIRDNYGDIFEIVPVPNAQSGLRDVSFQAVDAFVVNTGLAAYYIGQEGLSNLKVAGDAVFTYKFRMGVRKDMPILRDVLQKGLDLITEEERQDLRERWYSISTDTHRLTIVLRVVTVGLLVAVGTVVGFSAVNRTLKRKVRERTLALERELDEKMRMAENLRRSEERYELVVRGANDGIWDWDVRSGVVYFSPRWKAIIGYQDHEIENREDEWLSRIHPDDRTMVLKANADCRDGVVEQFEVEYRLRHKDGTYRWVLGRGIAVRDETGTAYRMAGTHSDITGRKRAAEELSRSNRLFRAVLHQAPFGIQIAQGNAQSWLLTASNREANRILGFPDEGVGTTGMVGGEFVNRQNVTFSMFSTSGDQLGLEEAPLVKVMSRGEKTSGGELLMRRADGRELVILVDAAPVHDEDGRLVAGVSIFVDITERKRAEVDRKRLRNLLQAIIDSMPSALVAVDAQGLVTQWNREARQLTGRGMFDAVGRPLEEVFPDLAGEMERIREAMRRRETRIFPRRPRMTADGQRYEDVAIYPLRFQGLGGAVVRVDDVTERTRIEEMMVQAEKMLSVGGLAAGMAHEINNPLGIIMQCAESSLRRVSPRIKANREVAERLGLDLDSMREYMEERGITGYMQGIRDAGIRAARIVANMLEFSRRSESRVQPCNLNAMLDSTLELAANDYDLKKKFDFRQLTITREYDPDLPNVSCSFTEIEQVLLNLFKNAAQALAEMKERPETPGMVIRTRREGHMAVIEVADNGPGMEENVRKRVFEPFFTTKPVGTGTGLGLSVSYFIVCTNHGGQFDVESAPGRGAKFTIRLPLGESET